MHQPGLRWSRGCGSGIGLSSHKNEFPSGVCINNFIEDRAGIDLAATSKHYLGFKGQGAFDTQYHVSYDRAEGELAAYRAHAEPPPVKKLAAEDKGQHVLFDHGDPYEPPMDATASLNSLVLTAPALGKKQVHKELWAGSKHHDIQVSCTNKPTTLVEAKRQEWNNQDHAFLSTYSSTQRTSQMVSALQYVGREGAVKRGLIKPDSTAEAGQPSQTGRKAKGEFVDERNKSFHKLDFRHPIPYTVKLKTMSQAHSDPEPAAEKPAAATA